MSSHGLTGLAADVLTGHVPRPTETPNSVMLLNRKFTHTLAIMLEDVRRVLDVLGCDAGSNEIDSVQFRHQDIEPQIYSALAQIVSTYSGHTKFNIKWAITNPADPARAEIEFSSSEYKTLCSLIESTVSRLGRMNNLCYRRFRNHLLMRHTHTCI